MISSNTAITASSLPSWRRARLFDETTLVYKGVRWSVFTYAGMEDFRRLPSSAIPRSRRAARALRRGRGAWHSSKRHWNDLYVDRDLTDAFLREQIRNSYLLVLRQNVTPRTLRDEILEYVAQHGLPE